MRPIYLPLSCVTFLALVLTSCRDTISSPTVTSAPPTATSPPPTPKPPTVTPPPPTPTPAAMPTLAPGTMHTDPKGVEQVWVPAGTFLMGTSDDEAEVARNLSPPSWALGRLGSERPQHEVRLTSGFWIDKYEVTHTAFQAFVDDGGYETQEYWSEDGWAWLEKQSASPTSTRCAAGTEPDHPQVCVTWYEAEAYAQWRGGQLPTEVQWEYAARGPESLIYPWGNAFDGSKANVVNSAGLTPVGSYPTGVSWVGAHDMAGNAMEWVQDWLDERYYQSSVHDDPPGPETGRRKVEKGGWWGSNPFVARSAYRHFEDPPNYQDHHIGFRVVSVAEPLD
jgi:formylglycine-generating enzyme required for sulfatase activity